MSFLSKLLSLIRGEEVFFVYLTNTHDSWCIHGVCVL